MAILLNLLFRRAACNTRVGVWAVYRSTVSACAFRHLDHPRWSIFLQKFLQMGHLVCSQNSSWDDDSTMHFNKVNNQDNHAPVIEL
jgi:hypothetical protein